MNMFEKIILSILLLLFPIFCYLFYIVTNKNIDEKHRDLALNFTILSVFYLVAKYQLNDYYTILLSSIPLLIAYKRGYKLIILGLFAASLIFYHDNEYLFLMLIGVVIALIFDPKFKFRKYLYTFTLTAFIAAICIDSSHLFYNLIFLVAYVLGAELENYTVTKGEEIIDYRIEFKNMKKEYEIRHSLFKITHEIKNPLAVCKAYIDMFNYDDPNCAKKYVPIISSEIDKLLILLQDFLLVNKDNINFDIMDVNVLLEDIVSSMSELRKLNIELETLDDEIFINGDYNRLTQVMTNLIKNSFEANANKVVVKLSLIDNTVAIDVIDNGDGINDEVKKKIYIPFFTTKKDGTGLGVSLSKEIIEAHNGTLEYNSSTNGTTARIVIPLCNI